MTPANRPEEEASAALQEDMARLELFPEELFIDRAYVNSVLTEDVAESGGLILCKPWRGAGVKPGLFGKRDFKVNVRDGTITCPAGEVEPFEPGAVVHFDPEACGPCSLRANCTQAASGKGRSVSACRFGYAPVGAACAAALGPPYTVPFPHFCNLGPTYDFDPILAGDQDGLLVTGSASLKNCYADWSPLFGNGSVDGKVFDLTGILAELTRQSANVYPAMGGSSSAVTQDSSSCASVGPPGPSASAEVGFRCCFSSDPRL